MNKNYTICNMNAAKHFLCCIFVLKRRNIMSKRRVIVVMKDGVIYGVYSSVGTLLRAGIVNRIPRTFYSHLKEGCVYKVGDYEIQRFWLNE